MSVDIKFYNSTVKNLNNLTFTDYYYRLKMLAQCVFKWENLPNGMNEKWIEQFLFNEGRCMFFNDKTKGFMVTRCTPNSTLNYYEEPTRLRPYALGYTGDDLEVGKECVLIRNNDEMLETDLTIRLYAYRLTNITRTIDVNINAQKTPVLLMGSEKQKLTLKNVYTKWEGNEPVIYGDKGLDGEMPVAIKTDAPIVFPDLQVQKQAIWNECLTFLGINNANTEKRERLITNEVDANDTHIELSAQCFLKAREFACEEINKLFGTNISVRKREEDEIQCITDTQLQSEI